MTKEPCGCGHERRWHKEDKTCRRRSCACTKFKAVPKERLTGPDQIWVCAACGRTREGDRYDMGDTSCVIHAVLCYKEKVKGAWKAVKSSDSPEDASA